MKTRACCRSGSVFTGMAVTLAGIGFVTAAGQEPAGGPALEIVALSATTGVSELRRLDALVDGLARTGELGLTSRQPDRQAPGRAHEGFMQYHQGVPVYGGGVSRQLAGGGVTVSIFGTIHQGIDVDTTPRLSPAEALARTEEHAGVGPATDDSPVLVILPHPFNGYVLAYRATMRDLRTYFLDAHTGRILHHESEVNEQSAVGAGLGIQGQRKKVSTSTAGGGFQAYDRLRPAEIVTLDLGYDEGRTAILLDARGETWAPSDVASDADNDWGDPAVVDGHAHAGFTYDYLTSEHGWNGMDGQNGRMLTMVNMESGKANAFFVPPPFGPEKTGAVGFGEWPDGAPLVSADIVAHEVMHGVTYFSVKERTGENLLDNHTYVPGPSSFTLGGQTFPCGDATIELNDGQRIPILCVDGRFLLFWNEGGAINEAYSDIIGTSVEFSLHEPGDRLPSADYRMGEDTGPPIRSLENPRSIRLTDDSVLRYPDAVGGGVRFLVGYDGRYITYTNLGYVDGRIVKLPSFGYDGVHWNSTILSHAFYLAIEGGTNRTTGRRVEGVGGANRRDIERALFRAMTDLMPARTSFRMTAAVIRQSAVDLFGAGSTTHRALDQALHAVGL